MLFLHGRHEVCYNPEDPQDYARGWPCKAPFEEIPSHLGYDYIQRLLASQGYATVSIRVNGINAQDYRLPDGGADARAAIVQAHLDWWVDLAAEHQVDLNQVVLVGHSRGGEGVDRASIQIPAGAPYRIAGQVLIAPTDFASHTAPYVPTVTLLPYCDGDVSDLQGQRFTDVARDLVPGDTSLKSSVLVMGANHNFFNTEWTPATSAAPSLDDWGGGDPGDTCSKGSPGRLTGGGQRKVGKAYVAGAVHLFTGDDDYLPMFDGSPVSVPSAGNAEVLTHAVGGGRDTRAPGADARPTLPTGDADARLCNGVESYNSTSFGVCGRHHDDWVTPDWPACDPAVAVRRLRRRREARPDPAARGRRRSRADVGDHPHRVSRGRRRRAEPAHEHQPVAAPGHRDRRLPRDGDGRRRRLRVAGRRRSLRSSAPPPMRLVRTTTQRRARCRHRPSNDSAAPAPAAPWTTPARSSSGRWPTGSPVLVPGCEELTDATVVEALHWYRLQVA